jgi:hypothetical protein
MNTQKQRLFQLGQVVATPGALEALIRNNTTGTEYLSRHATGDWGDICEEDKAANQQALSTGGRILSAYALGEEKIWIITDATADETGTRIATTLLLPDEY